MANSEENKYYLDFRGRKCVCVCFIIHENWSFWRFVEAHRVSEAARIKNLCQRLIHSQSAFNVRVQLQNVTHASTHQPEQRSQVVVVVEAPTRIEHVRTYTANTHTNTIQSSSSRMAG